MQSKIIVFCGKGGVGKTTLSLSMALRCAQNGKRVVVVSSIAGGTGGGTLLDMLFLLAKLRQQKQIDQVVAVVVMPDIFFPADDEEGLAWIGFASRGSGIQRLSSNA